MSRALAPLEPDAFLAWHARYHGAKGRARTWREWAMALHLEPNEETRRELVKQAAWTRRWQRLGQYDAMWGRGGR